MTSELTATVRTLSAADAEAVLDISRLCDIAEIGEADTDLEDVLEWLEHPTARAFGVPGRDGLDAFSWVSLRTGNVAHHSDVRVRPGADSAAGPVLLDQIRRAAHEVDPNRAVHTFVHTEDAVRQRWYQAVGGQRVRHFWRMVAALDHEIAAPQLPPSAQIRPVADLEPDLRTVADVVFTSFEEHFGRVPGERPSFDDFVTRAHAESGFDIGLWWLALVDDQPAGALIARQFDDVGYVDTLGTLAEFRGRGLARALLLTAFGEFHQRGLGRAILGVDASNPTGAVHLYESVGMRAEHAWGVWEVATLPG